MPVDRKSRLSEILKNHEADLLAEWVKEQHAGLGNAAVRIKEAELRDQCGRFVRLLQEASQSETTDINGPAWEGVREMLADVSRTRSL